MSPSFRAREQSSRPAYTPPQQTSMPAANGGAIAVPRVGARESFGESGFGIRDAESAIDERLPTDCRLRARRRRRPTSDDRLATHRRPTRGVARRAASRARHAAPNGRHPRGEARGQAQGRRR